MVRKRTRRNPGDPVTITIHPEVHKVICHQCVDTGDTLRERVHTLLCEALDRPDLLEPVAAAATA